MPIYASAGESKSFEPAPAGTHQAVCVDVIDKGMQDTQFGRKHKVDLAWQIAELRGDGKPFLVFKRYTLSLNEKANLRKDLESWRGQPFTPAEEAQFDVERLLGANCLINVQHKQTGDKTYANVMSVMPLLKGMPKIVAAADYVRVCNRPTDAAAEHHETPPEAPHQDITEDDVPFAWMMPLILPALALLGGVVA
jgi:hypothetical protein